MMRLVFGVLMILIGVGLLGWIAFNQFVEMQPQAEGKSPLVGSALAALMIFSGVVRIRMFLKQRRERQDRAVRDTA
jgi:uncharacterized membrane protein HdeD (DUF308 family)